MTDKLNLVIKKFMKKIAIANMSPWLTLFILWGLWYNSLCACEFAMIFSERMKVSRPKDTQRCKNLPKMYLHGNCYNIAQTKTTKLTKVENERYWP